jgi:hypothetical protein
MSGHDGRCLNRDTRSTKTLLFPLNEEVNSMSKLFYALVLVAVVLAGLTAMSCQSTGGGYGSGSEGGSYGSDGHFGHSH